ncbi:MAG: carbohydrate binding domain-containing protein [Chitinispirillia bacterium]|nr:carbohydrate binding domain-containing protein [Chitinispirillia bacterium]MCL2268198.1 carbohydrate binding domain-containing protein [Chitinispirillia bacterium]
MRITINFLWTVLIFAGVCLAAAPVDSVGNLLADPSFEAGGKGWNLWGAEADSVFRSGKAGLGVTNAEPKWSGADQAVVLPDGAARVTVSGWIMTDNVVSGREAWEKARISIEFKDGQGRLVGGYPPVAGQAEGTTEWVHYSRDYNVSDAAKIVVVQCALGNATGTAHFDDIVLTVRNRAGNLLKAGRLSGVMDGGEWYKLKAKPGVTGSHYVDWSGLLDAPAGKHGFLKVKDGKLVFENGTPARFWGTNLTAMDCFAPDAQIDSAVSRLAKMGVNMLRLHHMDAPWTTPNIFGNAPGTRAFSKESMRQLDYLISKCKERGIYVFLDLLVHRDFTEADGIENRPPDLGGKQVGFFSKKIIELQKEFNENLLNHVNQFTGTAYKDEPAIAASAFINESTIFSAFGGDILTPPYREELEGLWLESAYSSLDTAEQAELAAALLPVNASLADSLPVDPATVESVLWEFAKYEASEVEPGAVELESGPDYRRLAVFGLRYQDDIPRLSLKADGDVRESIKFLSSVEAGYFKDMSDHIRGAGVKYPLAGSNMPLPLLAMLKNNAELDIICSNEYWDHPQVWKIGHDWDRILEAPFHNRSQFRNPKANIVHRKSYYRVDGKPFVITEWNHCYPNEYVLEGVPLVAAYGALQGWDGVLQFDFNLQHLGVDRILNYKLSIQPEDVAQWVMAAPLFLRGDVKAAPGLVVEGINEEQLLNIPNYSEMLDENYHLPFITRVAKSFDGKPAGDIQKYAGFYDRNTGVIRSETGELSINSNAGYMTVDAPRVQGASGFIGGTEFDLQAVSVKISNRHASVFAVSADGNDLASSKRFYVIAAGPAKMKGQVYDPARHLLENAGAGDVLVQVIRGKITFKKAAGKKVEVFSLEIDGKRGKKMSVKKKKGTLGVFAFDKGRTLVYEVVVK